MMKDYRDYLNNKREWSIFIEIFYLPYWQNVPTLLPGHVQTGPVGCSLQILYDGQSIVEHELIAKD